MVFVDWHFTWCDTVAVWFILGRRHKQSSYPSETQKKRKKASRERIKASLSLNIPLSLSLFLFPRYNSTAWRWWWSVFSGLLFGERWSAQPRLTATVWVPRISSSSAAAGLCTNDRRWLVSQGRAQGFSEWGGQRRGAAQVRRQCHEHSNTHGYTIIPKPKLN